MSIEFVSIWIQSVSSLVRRNTALHKRTTVAFVSTLLLTGLFNGRALGEVDDKKTYTLAMGPTFSVGDRWRLTKTATQALERSTKPADADAKLMKMNSRIELVGVCMAKAVSEHGSWQKLQVEIEKLEFTAGGKTQVILRPGEVVDITTSKGVKEFELASGKKLPPDNKRLFSMVLGGQDSAEEVPLEDVFELSKPRQVGEAWSCDKGRLIQSLHGFAKEIDDQDASASAKFVSIDKDAMTAKWTATISVVTQKPPVAVEGGVPVKGSFESSIEVSQPISSKQGVWTNKTSADLRQAFKGKPGSKDAETLYEGKSIQTYNMKIEFIEDREKK